MKYLFTLSAFFISLTVCAQKWENIDSEFGPLPSSVQVFRSHEPVGGKRNTMYYVIADLKDRNLNFTTDTTGGRRLTPAAFYKKNNEPLLVVNTSFFTFDTHQNLNVVVKEGKMVSYNVHNIKKKDDFTWTHPFYGALGIFKNRTADVAWVYSDTTKKHAFASQKVVPAYTDTLNFISYKFIKKFFRPWKVKTAVSGGPVLVQNSQIKITNNEEMRFGGKAIDDKHPRTAIGYTYDNKLIILVCEGRSQRAAGLSLREMALVMKGLGCVEALNLDGGGSTCLLLNGKEVNRPSSSGQQRAVPSVFIIEDRR